MSAVLPPEGHPHRPLSRLADRFGATGAFLCALHCASLPLLLAFAPGAGVGFFFDESFEVGFTVFATLLAAFSLWVGYRRHRAFRALMFLLPGVAALWTGAFYPPVHESVVAHAVAMTLGGTLIAVAHVLNLRLSHGHVHDACCHH